MLLPLDVALDWARINSNKKALDTILYPFAHLWAAKSHLFDGENQTEDIYFQFTVCWEINKGVLDVGCIDPKANA